MKEFPQWMYYTSALEKSYSSAQLRQSGTTLHQHRKVSPARVLQFCPDTAPRHSGKDHYSSVLLRERFLWKCSSSERWELLHICSAPLQRRRVLTTNLTQEIYWEEGIPESDCLYRAKKSNPKLYKYRTDIKILKVKRLNIENLQGENW